MHKAAMYTIWGKRVYLRSYDENNDFDFYWSLVSQNGVREFLDPIPRSIVSELNFMRELCAKNNMLIFIVCDAEQKSPLGVTMLKNIDTYNGHAEVGRTAFAAEYRGTGIAKDAGVALYGRAFKSLRIRFLYERVFANNIANIKHVQKIGFRRCATLPAWSVSLGRTVDEYVMKLEKEVFFDLYGS